ncbi:5-carboxymethyl-2-hydroxymuconate semialdehyde dehydrogenase [Rhodopseudomonas palustris HaA2]|uniref:5-carboxymethyl-2-hydroxymuconate semialdehyde dehydrogenase n=1 Tax=Rhodopseudomonas palustris (strain HaA2) TaxID=316058 RepID=Q2IZE6_RHOP2|nr:5-carboxymethyl-2-hydroxymuconate semialdehyde dehydrogenase [Rhodopseudomonas palustris]ABD06414.1 5-carboxymethyl-2-hydroxymuconate semialdehyde dehydrogenase [Rhodopseudomonas palustris HaA2]
MADAAPPKTKADPAAAFQANLDRTAPLLKTLKADGIGHLIDGAIVPSSSGEVFETTSPIDNCVLAQVARGTSDDIDRAAQAAKRAFPAWRDMAASARRKLLHKVADAIEARADDIAVLECIDTGQAHRFMAKAAIRAAENFRFFADKCAEARDGLNTPSDEHWNVSTRVPIGPVGVITPWNTPFMLSTWKIAPALAAGCTVVHKPAEWSPVTADLLSRICKDAGLPDGVLNTVQGFGEEAGKALTEHPAIKAIAFVGETATGAAIMAQGAPTLKRVHFELGGKNPVIVFDDADLDRALDAVVFMIYSLNGERCTSSSRLLIQQSIADAFIDKLAARVRALKVGHPLDPATEVGPLIHQRHLDKVCSYFDIAKNEGATVAVGGARHDGPGGGNYVQPTLVTGARSNMRVAQDEVFGPFLTVIPFKDEADAIAIANDIRYGLTGYIWTGDMGRALRVADALEAGMIWLNSENVRHLPTPFGGMKQSGIGRDGGDYSFEFYMETKHVSLARGTHKIQRLGVM